MGDPTHQHHDWEPGIEDSGLFWTIPIGNGAIDVDPDTGKARFRGESVKVTDYHDFFNAVLGGGPAGLTAGYLLAKQGRPVIVFEAEDQVGGIAKTEVRDGYRFDLGGHRFFTKSEEVNELWHEVMREEFLLRPRMSRIF